MSAYAYQDGVSSGLADITPFEFENEASRAGRQFIEDAGDEAMFFAMKAESIFLDCPDYDPAAADNAPFFLGFPEEEDEWPTGLPPCAPRRWGARRIAG